MVKSLPTTTPSPKLACVLIQQLNIVMQLEDKTKLTYSQSLLLGSQKLRTSKIQLLLNHLKSLKFLFLLMIQIVSMNYQSNCLKQIKMILSLVQTVFIDLIKSIISGEYREMELIQLSFQKITSLQCKIFIRFIKRITS